MKCWSPQAASIRCRLWACCRVVPEVHFGDNMVEAAGKMGMLDRLLAPLTGKLSNMRALLQHLFTICRPFSRRGRGGGGGQDGGAGPAAGAAQGT